MNKLLISQKSNPSFGRAVYEGRLDGPPGKVVDVDTGAALLPQIEHVPIEVGTVSTDLPREVSRRVLSTSGVELDRVVDFQSMPTK